MLFGLLKLPVANVNVIWVELPTVTMSAKGHHWNVHHHTVIKSTYVVRNGTLFSFTSLVTVPLSHMLKSA